MISAWCIYHIRGELAPARATDPATKDGVKTWDGTLAGWHVLREQRELGPLVLINSTFAFVSAVVLITLLQQVVVTVDLNPGRAAGRHAQDGAEPLRAQAAHLRDQNGSPSVCSWPPSASASGSASHSAAGARLWSRSKALPYLALALLGAALIGFAQLHAYLPAVAGSVLLGLLSAFILIPIEARLQNDVDDARGAGGFLR